MSDICGFPDPGTFIREFKEEYDMTPAEYRRVNM